MSSLQNFGRFQPQSPLTQQSRTGPARPGELSELFKMARGVDLSAQGPGALVNVDKPSLAQLGGETRPPQQVRPAASLPRGTGVTETLEAATPPSQIQREPVAPKKLAFQLDPAVVAEARQAFNFQSDPEFTGRTLSGLKSLEGGDEAAAFFSNDPDFVPASALPDAARELLPGGKNVAGWVMSEQTPEGRALIHQLAGVKQEEETRLLNQVPGGQREAEGLRTELPSAVFDPAQSSAERARARRLAKQERRKRKKRRRFKERRERSKKVRDRLSQVDRDVSIAGRSITGL